MPIIFLTCGIAHFLEGLSYWHLTYPLNVPWTMVTADIGFAVLINSARFPAFIRGQDVFEELQVAQQHREELERQLALSAQAQREIEVLNARLHRTLRETHHRLKNNLQLISALTEIPVEDNSPTVPSSALTRIGQHARVFAAIHDLLTQNSKSDSEIEFLSTKELLDQLIPLLQATTGGRNIRAVFDDFPIHLQAGNSLAMLITELVSNSFKHGQGEIALTLHKQEHVAELEVYDHGSGFPTGFDPITNGNTGLELVEITGRNDLNGTLLYENRSEGGASTRLIFPIAVADFAQPPPTADLQNQSSAM